MDPAALPFLLSVASGEKRNAALETRIAATRALGHYHVIPTLTMQVGFWMIGVMRSRKLEILLIIAGVLAFVFFFPRLIIRWLGASSPWTPYFYLYGLGLVTFLIGLRIILRARSCQFGRGHDSAWFAILLIGYAFFALFHAAWILAALYLPFKGGP